MKKVFLIGMILLGLSVFASLANFNISNYKGDLPILSVTTVERTRDYYSVEGVVYNIQGANLSKKFLARNEVDSRLLTNERIVGYLGLTMTELRRFNGKDGPAMVGVNGLVFDVSRSSSWRTGNHKNQHNAGDELTHDIVRLSPHGVGRLVNNFRPYAILVFTPQELAQFTGRNKTKIYTAVNGIVYDVTNSREFANGVHRGHPAGVDLTREIYQLPNHINLLNRQNIYRIGLLVLRSTDVSAFDGKNNTKPYVIIENSVYDISSKANIDAGKDYGKEQKADSSWHLVGFKLW